MSDEPTLGEIARRLDDFRADVAKDFTNVTEEIRLLRADHIRRDVYDANRITDQQRIFSLEEKIKSLIDDKRSIKMLMWSAVFIAVAGFLFSLVEKVLFKH